MVILVAQRQSIWVTPEGHWFESNLRFLKLNNMTIAQQLKITEFPFIIKDKNGNQIYYENSNGIWIKREYDQNGNKIYYEDSNGFWCKRQYDQNSKEIYSEDSDGLIVDNRPKVVELTLDEIAAKLNIDVNLLKIKK